MTPNLASARKAIEAELLHAKQGMEFYSSRVEALEAALTQIQSVDTDDMSDDSKPRKGRSAQKAKPSEAKRGRKPSSASAEAEQGAGARKSRAAGGRKKASAQTGGAESLPTTGGEFWLRLVSEEPKTAVEIANAAVSEIGLAPDQKEQIQKIKQRVAPALTALVSAGKVKDTGAGRQRRFFKGDAA